MKILTSYFAKIQHSAPLGFAPVSIALKAPYPVEQYRKLVPPYKVFLMKDDPKAYTLHYELQVLNNLDPLDVLDDLREYGDKVLLLCWEGPGRFCHRYLVSKWLTKELDMNVTEWDGNLKI